jgi:hypothetical protein
VKYWPGTSIKKSTGNAFDWKNQISLAQDKDWKDSAQKAKNAIANAGIEKKQSIIIYSKAK